LELNVSVWSDDSVLHLGQCDVMASLAQRAAVTRSGASYEVLIPDVESVIAAERASLANRSTEAASWFDSYHTYAEIRTRLSELAAANPNITTLSTIGTSVQGNPIQAFVISGNKNATRRIVFLGGMHAREWISIPTVLYITEKLLTLYKNDSVVKDIVDKVDFHIIPVVNPDGYLFTWASNRLWRKNRRANAGGSYGVDLNRNFDDHWCGQGSSSTPSSDTYCGTAPFSEPETKAVSDYLKRTGPFNSFIDFHAYGQLILRPYGWTQTLSPDEAELKLVGDTIRSTILAQSAKAYTSQRAIQLYVTTGASDDWAYGAKVAKLVYCIELRDTGSYGFQLPANQIVPTGEENWAGVKYLSNYVATH